MPGPKKAQRTKGNVKPSSSSQAAQLLAASGHAPTGFIGFSLQPAFVPVSETFDEAESALDGDFRLVLRKLSKRDTVTKIKALQEFSGLCTSKDEDVVKAVVPFWPRIYNKVAIDVDHKVRELSQRATAALAGRTGKAMAPHLKSIMGMWVVSMCDTYPTVASAANQAFTSRFPGPKQVEAIRFCVTDIVECLSKNIMNHSKQSLSDPQTTSDEDMEAKYQRVITSSLQGLRKVMVMLSPGSSGSVSSFMTEHVSTLVGSPAFWKHAKSTVSSVKGGMLSLLSAICQHCQSASTSTITKISPFVFSFLNCTDPSIVSYAWEAVLSLVSTHEDCWQHVSWQKAVWPKLKNVLENGCSGQASIIAPCLLPFISKIPNLNFAHFFDSFRLGLIADNALNSPSELNSLVKSFQECMQYTVKYLNSENRTSETRDLMLDQMLTVVQGSLTDPKSSLSKTELFANLNGLLSTTQDVDATTEECFCSELSSFAIGRLLVEFESMKNQSNESVGYTPELFQRLTYLVKGLVYQEFAGGTKRERVKFTKSFDEETQGIKGQNVVAKSREKAAMTSSVEGFIGDMLVATFKLATVEERNSPPFVSLFSHLVTIHVPSMSTGRLNTGTDSIRIRISEDLGLEPELCITNHTSEDLVASLKAKLAQSEDDGDIEAACFVVDHLIPLLFHAETTHSEQTTRSVVKAMFAFLIQVGDWTSLEILSAVIESVSESFMMCQLIEHILKTAGQIPACKRLSEGPSFAEHVAKLVNMAAQGEDGKAATVTCSVWKMLTSVISHMDNDDNHTISEPCLDAVVSSCVSFLKKLADVDLGCNVNTQELSAVVGLVQVLLDKRKILTHQLLGELVVSLLPLLLQSHLAEKGEGSSLEHLWLVGVGLILHSKSDEEIQHQLTLMCGIIQNWVIEKVNSEQGLSCVKKVTQLLMSSVLVPWSEDVERNDISNRLLNMNLGDMEEEKEENAEFSDYDLASVSTVADRLLIKGSCDKQSWNKHCEHLYLSKRLSWLPSTNASGAVEGSQSSVQALVMSSLHNLSVLEMIMEINRRVDRGKENMAITPISEQQGICLRDMCAKLVLLEAAEEMDSSLLHQFSSCVSSVQEGLVRCFKALRCNQLNEVVAKICGDVSMGMCDLERLGTAGLLEKIIQEVEMTRKQCAMFHSNLLALRIDFVNRCELPDEAASEVIKLLAGSDCLSGDSVCEAFSLVVDKLLCQSDEDSLLKSISLCVSGFMRIASAYGLIDDGLKSRLFEQLLNMLNRLKERDIHLITSSDSTPVPSYLLQMNVSLARALKDLAVGTNEMYWEFTLCTLVEWIQFLSETQEELIHNSCMQALSISAWELSYEAALTFNPGLSVEGASSEVNVELAVTEKAQTEWNEFFSEGLFSPLLPMFVSLTASDSGWNHSVWSLIVSPLSSVVSLCPHWLVLNHQLPPNLTASDTSSLSDSLKTLLNHLCPLLRSKERCVEVAAFLLLKAVVGEISKQDLASLEEDSKEAKEEREEEMKSTPEAIMTQVKSAGHFLDCLKVVQVDDHVIMDHGTEERAQAMGYLLAWRLLLLLFKSSKDELRAKYAQYFKSQACVSCLLDHLFRLMPQHPKSSMTEPGEQLTLGLGDMNGEMKEEMEWLALQVYRSCLEILPALVRAWWIDQDRKSSNFVDHFTTEHLSYGLILQQIATAQGDRDEVSGVEGITIKTRPAAREVLATCEMAEVTVTMTITLPENYPLGKLGVTCDKRVGVSQAQWDRWLLQLNIFLQHQNGSIAEGLRLWKGNLDKKFEGLDDCMICFSVIHGTTLQLPRLTCRTCRKKFHSSCLYKWFSTSQKSSCPLCRNLF